MVERDLHVQSFTTTLMGWMVGAALFFLFNLRALAGRDHMHVEVVWIIFAIVPFLLTHFITNSTPLVFLSIYVILVSILNMMETWHNIEALESPQTRITTTNATSVQEEERQPLIGNVSTNTPTDNQYLVV
jgi:hypothetical protein